MEKIGLDVHKVGDASVIDIALTETNISLDEYMAAL
jgi:hypothetical protein